MTFLELNDCGDERCERHRALAGVTLRSNIIHLVAAAVLSSLLPAGADFLHLHPAAAVPAIHVPSTNHWLIVELPASRTAAAAGDPVLYQLPQPHSWLEHNTTWVLLIHDSGRLEVLGDREALLREFWLLPFWCRDIHIENWRLITPRWQVTLSDAHQVTLYGELDVDTRALWTAIAARRPRCP